MKYLFCPIILVLLFTGCEFDADLEAAHDPLLQVDAVFFNGEPFPEIRVRRTFNITGSSEYTVPDDQIWASGASLTVQRDNAVIAMQEHQPGRFLPEFEQPPVKKGDQFEINVKWEDLIAKSFAVVPDVVTTGAINLETNPLILQPDYYRVRDQQTDEIDSLVHYTAEIMYSQNIIPSMSAVALNSRSEIDVREEHGESLLLGRINREMFDYVNFFGDELEGLGQIRFNKILNFFYEKENDPDEKEVVVQAVIVIPEPIYADFSRTHSDYFSPITVTNVNGGAGMFIGAIRDTLKFTFKFPKEKIAESD
ncbi:MAG: hypothetical protein WD491_06805 [Balneolales bacterium]